MSVILVLKHNFNLLGDSLLLNQFGYGWNLFVIWNCCSAINYLIVVLLGISA